MGVWPKPLLRWASVESRGRARLRRVNRRLRRAERAVLQQFAAWDLTQDASEVRARPAAPPRPHTGAGSITYGCSLYLIRLQESAGVLSRLAFLASDAAVELSFRLDYSPTLHP